MAIDSPERVDVEPSQPKPRRSWRRAALAIGAVLIIVGATWGAYGMWQTRQWHKANLDAGLVSNRVTALSGGGATAWATKSDGTVYALTAKLHVVPAAGVATSHELIYQSRRIGYPRTLAVDSTGLVAMEVDLGSPSKPTYGIGFVRPSKEVEVIDSAILLPFDRARVTSLGFGPDNTLYVLATAPRGLQYVTELLKYSETIGWATLSQLGAGCGQCSLAVGANDAVYIHEPGTMVGGHPVSYLGRFTPQRGFERHWAPINLFVDGPIGVDARGGVVLGGVGDIRPGFPKDPTSGKGAQSYGTFLRISADKSQSAWPIVDQSGAPMYVSSLQPGPDSRTFYVMAEPRSAAVRNLPQLKLYSVQFPPGRNMGS
jgi:hypothetical protein